MKENRLQVVTAETASASKTAKQSTRTELQAKMERLWLIAPEQFDPTRNVIERERILRTKHLIETLNMQRGKSVDLGCGSGFISRILREDGWQTTAMDIASNALKAMKHLGDEGIATCQDALPNTKLADDEFDLVVCTDVIGYLNLRDYRLFMAELSRLVKKHGHVICSTAIDINSEDALQRFGALAETEFEIEKWVFSYHLLLLRLLHFFEIPHQYIRAAREPEVKKAELSKRNGFFRYWFQLNTTVIARFLWTPVSWCLVPIVSLLKQNKTVMKILERLCAFFWDESGISHAIFLGKRRPFIPPTRDDFESVEMKGKRQVWE